ncbi:MAG: MBL fold metallo-hydrolase [Actinobacteria bacterium]|nr:MBL fold metallo-hydrolase [Actinomycetota bacterium]
MFDTPSLGDRTYLATDGDVAVVVDPQRDWERVATAADERGITITHVLETHIHNDYVTGGLVLSREVGADYVVAAEDPVGYERIGAVDGMHLESGSIALEVVGTPGHTPTHLAYVLRADDGPVAVFTGGSMLFGSTGRTDLVAAELTERLTRDQHRSVRRLAAALSEDVEVCPTHGFGSFCSATEVSGSGTSTIGAEKQHNPALTMDLQRFVDKMLAGYDVYPAYYQHMAPLNRAGPSPLDTSEPERIGADEVRRRVRQRYGWVVDLRDRREFAAGHLSGTIGIERNDLFATYYGWIAPWGVPLTLLASTDDQIGEIQVELARIGIDRPDGILVGDLDWRDEERRTYPVVGFDAVARERQERAVRVLDVRRDLEWRERHLEGAIHIPLHELEVRIDELPHEEVWVHCKGGFRASIAASLLDRVGRPVVLIDDDWERALEHPDLRTVSEDAS